MNDLLLQPNELMEMYRLKNIIRYNHRSKIANENVAEHSFFVSMITLQLCKKFNLTEHYTFLAVVKAMLHDMPEIELNDITYDVKLRLNLQPMLQNYEDEYYNRLFPDYAKLMANTDDNVVNLIVKYADAMSVLQYSDNEALLGNQGFFEIAKDAIQRMQIIHDKLMEAIKDEKYF